MALYKGSGPMPDRGVRVNWQVWTRPGVGSYIKGWGYPTQSPSNRFRQYDTAARNLDDAYRELPADTKGNWNKFAQMCPWQAYCPYMHKY